MSIFVHIQGVHHDPKYWPEPLEYRPERFLVPDDIEPFTFIPFIDGPRNCLGQHLSLLESKTVLALLALRFNFTITNRDTAGLKHSFMVPIIPKTGHFVKVQ
jgi:cytochrome P450